LEHVVCKPGMPEVGLILVSIIKSRYSTSQVYKYLSKG
jgi:hypothetical protein